MIHPILRCLASTLDWHKVADLGWPLFRLLARVEPLVRALELLLHHGIKTVKPDLLIFCQESCSRRAWDDKPFEHLVRSKLVERCLRRMDSLAISCFVAVAEPLIGVHASARKCHTWSWCKDTSMKASQSQQLHLRSHGIGIDDPPK